MTTYRIERHTTSALARMADVTDPDVPRASSYAYGGEQVRPETPGSTWLHAVEDALADAVEYVQDQGDEYDADDEVHEFADSAVEVYTHNRWLVFVDLAMWQVDIEDMVDAGNPNPDMTLMAGIAQYEAARTLVHALLEAWEVEDEVIHLRPTRGDKSACGESVGSYVMTTELDNVTCEDCLAEHDRAVQQ